MLDIGGDVGAAIVHRTGVARRGRDRDPPCGRAWDGTHVAVRARHLSDGVVHAALFGSLTQGGYQVRVRGGHRERPHATFQVEAGRVTTADLRY